MKVSQSLAQIAILVLGFPALAEKVCVRSHAEYVANTGKMPDFIQKLPKVLYTNGLMVKAALTIDHDGENLTLIGSSSREEGQLDTDSFYIKEACFEGDKLVIHLENQQKLTVEGKPKAKPSPKTVKVGQGNKVSISMFDFTVSDDLKDFDRMTTQIRDRKVEKMKTYGGVQ